jgi:hypothetical protein
MPQWNKKATDLTSTYDAQQGREFTLDVWKVPWKLVTFHKSGDRRTLGIWGKDASNRDILIYNGPYADGQEILVDANYSAVHVAVGFVPDNPPKNQRWFFQGGWWRQAYYPSAVDVDVYYYR